MFSSGVWLLTQVPEQISVQQKHVFMHLVPFVQVEVEITAVANHTLLKNNLFTREVFCIPIGMPGPLVLIFTLLKFLCLKFYQIIVGNRL